MSQEIATNSVIANQKVASVKVGMEFFMSFTMPSGNGTNTMMMQETATSAVNIPDKLMDMAVSMTIEIPNEGKQSMSGEIYLIDGWMYANPIAPTANNQWTKLKLTDELWAMQSQLLGMSDFLKSPVGLELLGNENINGVDCYVLSVIPNVSSLTSWMEGQMQAGQTSVDLSKIDISKMLQNYTIKEWIAKDSYLPSKLQIGIKMDGASLESSGYSSAAQMNMEMNATFMYYDYGKTVNIQLPPEALNATEITMPER